MDVQNFEKKKLPFLLYEETNVGVKMGSLIVSNSLASILQVGLHRDLHEDRCVTIFAGIFCLSFAIKSAGSRACL